MKRISLLTLLFFLPLFLLTGCDFIGDLAEGVFWIFIIGVVVGIALIIWIVKKLFD